MPVSPSQHRSSIGSHQNKIHKTFRENREKKSNPSAIPDTILYFWEYIYQSIHSHEELNRSSSSRNFHQPSIIAPLIMLLSQIRLTDFPLSSRPYSPVSILRDTVIPSSSEYSILTDRNNADLSTPLTPIINAIYKVGDFISQHDPLKFPGADAHPVSENKNSGTHRNIEKIRHSQRYIPSPSMKRENNKITKLLRKENIIEKGKLTKEELISAVADYLFSGDNGITGNKKEVKKLARNILAANGLWGGEKHEKISISQAESAIRQWTFNNILGMFPVDYILNKIAENDYPGYYTVSGVYYLLSINKLLEDKYLHLNRIPSSKLGVLNTMWYHFLTEEMPFLKFSDRSLEGMPLNDYNFAHLYSGSRFFQETSIKEYTSEEAMNAGEKMWDLAAREGVKEDDLPYYSVPALFFKNSISLKKEKNINHLNAVNDYIQYREKTSEIKKDIEKKYDEYISSTKKWVRKGKLADNIIEKCPTHSLKSGITNIADAILTPEKRREKAVNFSKQSYLNGMSLSCKSAPKNLDTEYQKITSDVANRFGEIDKYLILSAFSTLPEEECEFISSPNSSIQPANAYVQLLQPGHISPSQKHYVENTDLFVVSQGEEERTYALKGDKTFDNGYRIIRVDSDIRKYIKNGIFGEIFSEYKFTWDNIEDSRDINCFNVAKTDSVITGDVNHIVLITDYLRNKHRDILYNTLYEAGNDKSDIQKIWSVVKHIIPFYDCVEGIINKDIEHAVPACLIDAISFISVFGSVASLNGKFGMGLVRGGVSGAFTVGKNGMNVAGKNLLREINLPATEELAQLGKNSLNAIDPGIGLVTGISKKLGNSVIDLLSSDKKTAEFAKNIISAGVLDKLPHNPPSNVIMASLPQTQLQHPVTIVGKQGEKNIYARVNIETGENFGGKYFLDSMGNLEPVPIPIPVSTQIKNIQREVLVGRGSILSSQNSRISPVNIEMTESKRYLEQKITPDMFAKNVDANTLSAPDHMGVRTGTNGNKYINYNLELIKIEQRKGHPFIKLDNGDKVYVKYQNYEFNVVNVVSKNGLLSSHISEVNADSLLMTQSGLELSGIKQLNAAWSIEKVNIKNPGFSKNDSIGSRIDVTLTMKYKKQHDNKYIEIPAIEWNEKINSKEEKSIWQFHVDMYKHNPTSVTFFPWRNRYVAAYDFAKEKNKSSFNGSVKIYKENMEPLGIKDIKKSDSPIEKTESIQKYLSKNGGVIEITITDYPQLLKRRGNVNRERKIAFNIGFNNEVVAHFSQGIILRPNGYTDAFVTTSDKVKIAHGKINSQPPEIVTKPREHHFLQGEVH
ncbi:hypothetical protein LOZ86_11485 [Pectobacterium parvum]|uniref:hypothetical protein n=1 Tax=Pectobacterium parvum TaxID=2778550 RepID=UPI001E50FD59|nr:hypothetical protein [Pectobacterium parvum]UFK37623.1 hypothetical protein LOZ86_11485 [Pectobacterium parvum]